MNRLLVFPEVVLVFEPPAADLAREPRLDPALHPLVQVQRLLPLVRLAAGVARIARPVREHRQPCNQKRSALISCAERLVLDLIVTWNRAVAREETPLPVTFLDVLFIFALSSTSYHSRREKYVEQDCFVALFDLDEFIGTSMRTRVRCEDDS